MRPRKAPPVGRSHRPQPRPRAADYNPLMQRVIVIGSGGAGKSNFSTRLSRATGLPVIHLDTLYWKPGWVESGQPEWTETVARLCAAERWVMDGNYGGTLGMRMAACDTVVFLDMPRWLCLWRAMKRYVQYRGRARPDMTTGCPEQLSFAFLRWIWRYPRERRPKILAMLAILRVEQRAVVLQSEAAVNRFLTVSAVSPGMR